MILGLLTALSLAAPAETELPVAIPDPGAVEAPPPPVELRLDLGPADGTVLDGFVELTPWTSADPRARFAPGGRPSADNWPDPLVGDSVVRGTLHLDLPPGTYRLGALFQDNRWGARPRPGHRSGLRQGDDLLVAQTTPTGDAFFSSRFYAHDPRPVFRPGQDAWDRQLAHTWAWRPDVLTVPEGGVDLVIEGEPLAALVITEADLATLEVELAQVDAVRGDWWRAHSPPVDEPVPVAREKLAGVEILEWDERPSVDPVDATLQARWTEAVAPGRRITGLVAVHGPDKGVEVSLDAPAGWSVELYEVSWLDANEERIVRVRPHVLHPLDGSAGTLEGGQGLIPLLGWAVTVPADAPPATEPVQLVVRSGDDVATVDISVRVRDLTLEQPSVRVGFWADLDGATAAVYGPDSDQARAQWAAAVQLMRSRGADALGLRGTFFPGDWFSVGGPYPVERFAWAARTWHDAGGGTITWLDPSFAILRALRRSDPEKPPLSAEDLASLEELDQAARDAGASVFVLDEEIARSGPEAIPRVSELLVQLDGVFDVPMTGAVTHPGGWNLGAALLDVVYFNRRPYLSRDHLRAFDGKRATPWAYNIGVGRESSGRLPFYLGTEGVLLWHLNEHHGDPFVQLQVKDWMFAMPLPDRGEVLPLTRMELFSEGVQDLAVLSTLAARVHELQGRKRERIQREVDRACTILEVVGSGLEGVRPGDWADQPMADGRSLDRLRTLAGDQAEVLSRWSRRQRRLRRGRAVPDLPRGVPEGCRNGSAPAPAGSAP